MINNFRTKLNNGTIVELKIPRDLAKKDVKRIAAEYGTLYVQIKDTISRTNLYEHDLDRTVYRLLKNAINIFPTTNPKWQCFVSDEIETIHLIAAYIRQQWLSLIGVNSETI